MGAPGNSVIQMYVDGSLVKSVPGKWEADGKVQAFDNADALLDGDVLIRVRHEDLKTKTRVSVFRVALHTGYTPSGVMHLAAEEVDGGKDNSWMEFDFVPRADRGSSTPTKLSKGLATSEAQFWDLISRRRESNKRKLEEAQAVFSILDTTTPMRGGGGGGGASASNNGHGGSDDDTNNGGKGGGDVLTPLNKASKGSMATSSASQKKTESESRADELDAELSTLLSPSAAIKSPSSTASQASGPQPPASASSSRNNNNKGNNAAAAADEDDDDLDEELEDYLKKLG
jgi:hypothetical protein